MTPEQIDRVFGRGRLKMVTGEHVEVFREAVIAGERRRYTKRFLNSTDGDFAHWTEREWKILARLIGHGIGCVPDVVQFDRGSATGAQLVQTYDAGVTVDQWATLLPLCRDGHIYRHAFEDCAHWWALAHYCVKALKEIHQLQLVHLDIKGDNVCIPFGPATFDPEADGSPLYPLFGQLALIDFAFSVVSGENLAVALPIGQQREYDYQSPRLIEALAAGHDGNLSRTRELDWRCDFYSLAAMLDRYLPGNAAARTSGRPTGWTKGRYDAASTLIASLRQHHDADAPQRLPHQSIIDTTSALLSEGDLAQSLAAGWTLAHGDALVAGVAAPLTPMTRIAPPVRVFRKPRERGKEAPRQRGEEAPHDGTVSASPPGRTPALAFAAPTDLRKARMQRRDTGAPLLMPRQSDDRPPPAERHARAPIAALTGVVALALSAAVAHQIFPDATNGAMTSARGWFGTGERGNRSALPSAAEGAAGTPPSAASTAAKGDASPEPATKVAAAKPAPSPAASADASATHDSNAVSNGSAPAPDERADDAADGGNAEPADAAAASSTPKADTASAPSASRGNRGATPPASESTPRTTARRPPTKPAQVSPARPSPSIASAPAPTAKAPPSRYAMSTPRGSAPSVTSYHPGAGSAAAPAEGARVETAPAPPVHVIELAPPTNHLHAEATPSATPQDKAAPANPAIAASPDRASASDAPPPASKPSTQRRTRPLAADEEWRAGLNSLAQFFGFTKRKSAPIEDRGFQEVAPSPKPPRAPQASTPVQERAATPPPKSDVSTFATPPAAVATIPRIDTPPPPVVSAPSVSRTPVPPPVSAESRVDFRAPERMREADYASEARRALLQSVPRIAQQTQSEIAPVLWAAARAQDPRTERDVIDAAQAVWVRDGATTLPQPGEAAAARRLNDEAMQAYWVRRNIPEAFDLSLKAFGANPSDPEVVGNLAFLHLRMTPSQPEMARQLALHAIAVRGTRFRSGRLEDWNTFALASALTGRDADARNAMYVTVALAGSVERNCKAGLSAMANYGERVREPVEAMLYRIHSQGRAYDSPYCAWPPNRSAMGMRQQ
jgi:hypothetical protein